MRLYLAGTMRGYPRFNYPAFHAAAAELRTAGFEVFNPAELDNADELSRDGVIAEAEAKGFDLAATLLMDLGYVAKEAHGVATLPGWYASAGASAEVSLARALGKPVRTVRGWLVNRGA